MNGAQIGSNSSLGKVGAEQHVVGIGDFNGDGKADILFRSDNGTLSTWQMNGGQIQSQPEPRRGRPRMARLRHRRLRRRRQGRHPVPQRQRHRGGVGDERHANRGPADRQPARDRRKPRRASLRGPLWKSADQVQYAYARSKRRPFIWFSRPRLLDRLPINLLDPPHTRRQLLLRIATRPQPEPCNPHRWPSRPRRPAPSCSPVQWQPASAASATTCEQAKSRLVHPGGPPSEPRTWRQ